MRRLLLVCIALSAMVGQSALAQVTAKDVQQWESECARGDALSCGAAGYSYDHGDIKGGKQDKFKAGELYTKACDGGYAGGCYNLGFMYADRSQIAAFLTAWVWMLLAVPLPTT